MKATATTRQRGRSTERQGDTSSFMAALQFEGSRKVRTEENCRGRKTVTTSGFLTSEMKKKKKKHKKNPQKTLKKTQKHKKKTHKKQQNKKKTHQKHQKKKNP